MLFDCIRNQRDVVWVYVVLFLNSPGALLYFFACWLPRQKIPLPQFLGQWTRREEIWRAEAQALTIGNAYQYVQLGTILHETNQAERAKLAYGQALAKEPLNLEALWGLAMVSANLKDFDTARSHLETLLLHRPDYQFGAASLTYGQVLFSQGFLQEALTHLELHLKTWGQLETYLWLARLYEQLGDRPTAKTALETMIIKGRGAAPYYVKQNRPLLREAETLLRQLR